MSRFARQATSAILSISVVLSFLCFRPVINAEELEDTEEILTETVETEEEIEAPEEIPEEITDETEAPSEDEEADVEQEVSDVIPDTYLAGGTDIEVIISYYYADGTPMPVNQYFDTLDTLTVKKDSSITSFDVTAEYDNGQTVNATISLNRVNLSNLTGFKAACNDATSVKFTLSGFIGTFNFTQPGAQYFSRMIFKGTNPDSSTVVEEDWDARWYNSRTDALTTGDFAVSAGQTYEIAYFEPVTYDGTVSFSSYDGSVTGDFVYYFTMNFSGHSNFDMSKFYWTLDSDASNTPHGATSIDGNGRREYIFEVPIGDSITLHNIPLGCTYVSYMPPAYVYDTNGQGVKYNGNTLTTSDVYGLGLSNNLIYTVERESIPDPTRNMMIIMSGYIGAWNVGNNFKINVFMLRTESQFVFSKMYDPADPYADPAALHDFRVTLTDTVTGLPYADKDVAVSYFTDIYETLDKASTLMHTNANGELNISIPAGTYVRLGRGMPMNYSEPDASQPGKTVFYSGEIGGYASFNEYRNSFFPELGMLPGDIKYKIEEISDDYIATVTGDAEVVVHNPQTGYGDWPSDSDNISWSALSSLINFLPSQCSATPPEFTNARVLGSLEVTKTMKNATSEDPFLVTVTFTGANGLFPTDLPCTYPNGTNGALAVTYDAASDSYTVTFELKKDETMKITGIPAGVSYEVKEDAASASGYEVTYTNGSGVITQGTISASVTNAIKPAYVPATGEDASAYYGIAVTFIAISAAIVVFTIRRKAEQK